MLQQQEYPKNLSQTGRERRPHRGHSRRYLRQGEYEADINALLYEQ
jgi:hypothetical protein